ncbi:SUA5/YciO/yrdC, N-terminal domain [gamma proteobacterium NOR5-3]|nr:SUA5/YciO/yrdC, N-terminal domain [gamma proteobacterium NOR5-3]
MLPAANFRTRLCANVLAGGGVIACPTEAVWGLSCDPFSGSAVQRLLDLKQRPAHKGLILVAGDESQLEFLLADLAPALRQKLRVSWPGPNTWLVPHHGRVPALVHGKFESVAVRVSGHPGVRELCRVYGGPLVSSSANVAGQPAPKTLLAVRNYFGTRLDGLLPGQVAAAGRPSTIRDVFTDEVFRA